jgi:hypothetical protein
LDRYTSAKIAARKNATLAFLSSQVISLQNYTRVWTLIGNHLSPKHAISEDDTMTLESAALIGALRKCLGNLEETLAGLVEFAASLPQGATRDRLSDKTSCLDSMADVMKQALDAFPGSANAGEG